MRATTLAFAIVLSMAVPAVTQEWTEYQNIQDGFKINFPGQPKIAEMTWTSEFGYVLPARVYTAERGRERYSLTVADYSPIEQSPRAREEVPPGRRTLPGQRALRPELLEARRPRRAHPCHVEVP